MFLKYYFDKNYILITTLLAVYNGFTTTITKLLMELNDMAKDIELKLNNLNNKESKAEMHTNFL